MSKLSEPMKAALRTGRDNLSVECSNRTFDALLRRGLVNNHVGNLTQKGIEALAELDAQEAQEKLAERVVYRVEIESVEPVEVDGESKYRDLYRVYRSGSPIVIDTWTATEGEPDYPDSTAQLAAHGWTLHGCFTWDSTARLYTGLVALDTTLQPVQETAAEPQPEVCECESLPSLDFEPQPEVIREDVRYVVQVSETGGETWRNLVIPSFEQKASAQGAATGYGVRFPAQLFRVIEVRETWAVV